MASAANHQTAIPSNNPYNDLNIGKSLATLAAKYAEQAAVDREEALQREKAAEDTRRFNLQQSRLDKADAESLRRWTAEQDRLDAATKESARRYGIEDSYRQAAQKRQEEADRRAEEARQLTKRANLWQYNLATQPKNFTLDTADPSIQNKVNSVVDSIQDEQQQLRKYLESAHSPEQLSTLRDTYQKNIENTGLTDAAKKQKLALFDREMQALRSELGFNDSALVRAGQRSIGSPIQETDRIVKTLDQNLTAQNQPAIQEKLAEIGQTFYQPRLDSINEAIRSGKALTKEQQYQQLLEQVPPELRGEIDYAKLKSMVYDTLDAPTRAELVSQAQATADAQNKALQHQLDNYDKYIQRQISADKEYSSKKDAKTNWEDYAKAYEQINKLDIGFWDNADAAKGFKTLVEVHGMKPDQAAAVIYMGIDKGALGDSFPSVGSEKFAKIVQMGKNLEDSSYSKNGKTYIDRDKYNFKYVTPETPEDLLAKRFLLNPAGTSSYGADPAYMSLLPKPSNYTGPTPHSISSDSGTEPEDYPAPKHTPEQVTVTPEKVKAALDLDWNTSAPIGTAGTITLGDARTTKVPSTRREILSKQILDKEAEVAKNAQELSSSSFVRKAWNERQLRESRSELRKLQEELLRLPQ